MWHENNNKDIVFVCYLFLDTYFIDGWVTSLILICLFIWKQFIGIETKYIILLLSKLYILGITIFIANNLYKINIVIDTHK